MQRMLGTAATAPSEIAPVRFSNRNPIGPKYRGLKFAETCITSEGAFALH
jgi:hypothetical protein